MILEYEYVVIFALLILTDEDGDACEAPEENAQFFERVKSETKQELSKELTKDTKKEKVRKSFNNDTITIAHLQVCHYVIYLSNYYIYFPTFAGKS